MDVLHLIREDHEDATELFRRVESGAAIWGELRLALMVHAHGEEASIYPFLETRRDTKGVAKDYLADHGRLERLIESVDLALGEETEWREPFRELKRMFDAHVEEEEEELF